MTRLAPGSGLPSRLLGAAVLLLLAAYAVNRAVGLLGEVWVGIVVVIAAAALLAGGIAWWRQRRRGW